MKILPTQRLGEVVVGIVFTVFATALVVKGQYILSIILFPALVVLLKLDLLEEVVFSRNEGIRVRFYKSELADLLGIPKSRINKIHFERIRLEPYGEVIIAIAIKDTIRMRFIANIERAFEKLTTIELLIGEQIVNTLSIMEWMTGNFKDTTQNNPNLPIDIDSVSIKVRVKTGNDTKMFGPILVPLSV